MSKRSSRVIRNDLNRVRTAHANLNEEIDTLNRRQGLGNSMDLQQKKNTRAGYKRRIAELEIELADAEAREAARAAESHIDRPVAMVSG